MKLGIAISEAQDAERDLASQLRVVGERHAVQHDLYHLSHTLARQCETHLERLRPFAERYGSDLDARGVGETATLIERLCHKTAELVGRTEATRLLLLRDLRDAYLQAQEAEILWVVVAQAAQAVRDPELLATVGEIREHAELRAKWLRTRLKELSPQILVAG